jgi:parallel beta-helix repeat protein
MKSHTSLSIVLFVVISLFLINRQAVVVSTPSQIAFQKSYTPSYTPHAAIWIQSNEEFQAQADSEHWPGAGTEGNPFVITGYSFNQDTQPIRIWNTDVYWIVAGNLMTGTPGSAQCGPWVEECSNGAITDNEIYNRHSGMYISNVDNLVISNNLIHDCSGNGIEVAGAMENTTIEKNTIWNIGATGILSSASVSCSVKGNMLSDIDDMGITLGVSPDCNVSENSVENCGSTGIMMSVASRCLVTNNNITRTADFGLYMNGALECSISGNRISNVDGVGIKLYSTRNSSAYENSIANCSGVGFLLLSGVDSRIHWNHIKNTSVYAIDIESDCTNFSIMYNSFVDCGSNCQLKDDGTANIVAYNYYSDWTSPDDNSDGFVDSPYVLDGEAANQDAYPLAVDGVIPTTTSSTGSGEIVEGIPPEVLLGAGAATLIVLLGIILVLKRR